MLEPLRRLPGIRRFFPRGAPYNWNWQRIDFASLDRYLSEHPIHLVDIGARVGAPAELASLKPYLRVTGFDADKQEVNRLNSCDHTEYAHYQAFPFLVGSGAGPRSFYLYRYGRHNSTLLPNKDYQRHFDANLQVEAELTVESTTLDALEASGALAKVDMLKLDTQGTEYEILDSAARVLKQALLVEVEVSFLERYQGQKLAFEIMRLLHDRGFDPLYLSRNFYARSCYEGRTRGQICVADMLFCVNDARAQTLPTFEKFKLIVLLMQYGVMDFAYSVYKADQVLQEIVPALGDYFSPSLSGFDKWSAGSSRYLDRLIAILLHLRRTNGLPGDSDRAWPIR